MNWKKQLLSEHMTDKTSVSILSKSPLRLTENADKIAQHMVSVLQTLRSNLKSAEQSQIQGILSLFNFVYRGGHYG